MSATAKIWSTPGGVHPPENKHQSLSCPITTAPLPKILVLPLNMHIGAPAEPIVKVGDKVLKGQCIATAKGFVSVPIHAPSSGVIEAIEPRPIIHASGMQAPCIVIKTDGLDQWCELKPITDYQTIAKPDLLNHIRDAGIAGMGGAGFPSAVKLATDKVVEELIINGTECEPYITADDILMQEKADEIVAGVAILKHLLSPRRTIIGIEDNKPDAIIAMRKAIEGTDIEVVVFPTKYPSGGEKQLITILTGKEVKSGGLPADVGVVCQNVGTAQAIYRAVHFGEPLISRVTTLTGKALNAPKNYLVRLGTLIDELLHLSGFDPDKAERVISGGPMMGFAVSALEVPIVKTTNCILAPDKKELPAPPPAQACIRCGMCAEACPAGLLPQQLFWFAQAKDHEGLQKHHLADCIECGACSYVCPSNIPLVQYYRASKADIRQAEIDHQNAEHAKARFEARLARIEQAEAEKEAKRKARQAKAKPKTAAASTPTPKETSGDPVSDAIARAQANAKNADDTTVSKPIKKAAVVDLDTLQKRLAKAELKLEKAKTNPGANIEAFERAVALAKEKIADFKPTSTVDPVADAIAKAQAKRTSSESGDSTESAIASLKKRIVKADEKYQLAKTNGDETADILKQSLDKLNAKLAALTSAPKKDEADADDPVAAAIAKAQAKRQDGEARDAAAEKAKAVAILQKRITKSQVQYEKAVDENLDTQEALKGALDKLTAKLDALSQNQASEKTVAEKSDANDPVADAIAKAQAKRHNEKSIAAKPADSVAAPLAEAHDDPVAAAIAKAQAKRQSQTALSPKDRLEKDLASISKRIAVAEEKYKIAQAADDEKAAILASTLEKLQSKRDQTQQELEQL